jgi:hypothetical protein
MLIVSIVKKAALLLLVVLLVLVVFDLLLESGVVTFLPTELTQPLYHFGFTCGGPIFLMVCGVLSIGYAIYSIRLGEAQALVEFYWLVRKAKNPAIFYGFVLLYLAIGVEALLFGFSFLYLCH